MLKTGLLAMLAMATAGCQIGSKADFDRWKVSNVFDLNKGMPWHKDDEPQPGTPVRLVDVWTDTVLHRQGESSRRGFGGRIHFYSPEGGEPILVDGQLVVYAFDESNREATDNRPTKRFVFPPDQLKHHMSESKLGPSYSFWLPWDEVGGNQKDVSLICRFEPAGGALIVGEQTQHRLPGTMIASKRAESETDESSGPSRLQQIAAETADGSRNSLANYEQASTAQQESDQTKSKMKTTSISLPSRYGNR